MITAQQIKERLTGEKDPLRYIDGAVARCTGQMSDRCENIQRILTIYNQQADKSDPFELQDIKEDLMKMGELYFEINTYLKVRKEAVQHQKKADQVSKALAKRQKRND